MLCEQLLQLCVFLLIRITMVAFYFFSTPIMSLSATRGPIRPVRNHSCWPAMYTALVSSARPPPPDPSCFLPNCSATAVAAGAGVLQRAEPAVLRPLWLATAPDCLQPAVVSWQPGCAQQRSVGGHVCVWHPSEATVESEWQTAGRPREWPSIIGGVRDQLEGSEGFF